jgi:hypothetical protein
MSSVMLAKVVVLAAAAVMVAIRAPHGQRSRKVAVARRWRGGLEAVLLTSAWLGFFVPLIWIVAPGVLAFADHPASPAGLAAGVAALAAGLWRFHRSHADLYARVRHPMYAWAPRNR